LKLTMSDVQLKFLLIAVSVGVSLIAQSNLKATSPQLPNNFDQLMNGNIKVQLWILSRAIFFSGLSLVISWYAYKKFGFLELMVAQSVIYFAALLVSYFVFHEPVGLNKIGAVTLISMGVALFYWK